MFLKKSRGSLDMPPSPILCAPQFCTHTLFHRDVMVILLRLRYARTALKTSLKKRGGKKP
jgi:hypothetical protein